MTICRGAFNRVIPASGRGHAWPGAVRRKERTSWPTTTSSRAAARGIRLGQPPHREPPGAGPRPGGRESGSEPPDSRARRRRHARDPHVNCRFRTVPQASSTTANQVSARRGLGGSSATNSMIYIRGPTRGLRPRGESRQSWLVIQRHPAVLQEVGGKRPLDVRIPR